ncbi:MAG: hypothetical protein U0T83_04710 [Bacteriovoracaceae bacterium]
MTNNFLTQIKISNTNLQNMEPVLKPLELGKASYAFIFDKAIGIKDFISVVTLLEEHLTKLKINPRFPYPIYLVSDYDLSDCSFFIIKQIKDIPKYFLEMPGRPGSKELQTIKKLNILRNKIINSDINEKQKLLKNFSFKNKKLFNILKEIDFYEEITKKIY